jgi:phosphatidylglycerol lysyltransferase
MDNLNRFHTRTTFWIVRAENIALLLILSGLLVWRAGEVHWWRAVAAFWIIDIVGYLPGALVFRRSKDGQISRWYHNIYNIAHTYLVTGSGVALWAYAIGGFEWAMLAVPIHLAVDRGVFGNTLKPVELSFEPHQHSDETVLRALGRTGNIPAEQAARTPSDGAAIAPAVSKDVLVDVLDHPSGYLALTRRNRMFVADDIPGFISYRKKGKHLWLFGGVHARPEHAGPLLDRFLGFAAEDRRRVAAVQVRESQVDLFAGRGFTVNQLGSTYAVSLKSFSLAGSQKMQLRNKIQKARRLGLKVVELGKDVPGDATWFAKLDEISRRWLEGKGKKELDFMVGEIGGPDDRDRRIFLVLDGGEDPIAFISYVPVWGSERPGYLHDLTRRIPDAPSGAMELCNAEAIARLKEEGVKYLHFGFTPFITDAAEGQASSPLITRVVQWLRKNGQKIYPADSQAAYKMKWGTDVIEREYVAARPLSFRAVFDLLLLTRSV